MTRTSFFYTANGLCQRTGAGVDLLCVFFDARAVAHMSLFDMLGEALKEQALLPDGVLVLADEHVIDGLIEQWVADSSERETFIGRGERGELSFTKSYQFASWRRDGTIELKDAEALDADFILSMDRVVSEGVRALVARNPVVQVAPGGHAFKHPSGTVNKVFLQARELAANEAELAFAARALVRCMPALSGKSLDLVYIDTMGVYALVREAAAFANQKVSVQSFHSYDDIAGLRPSTEAHAVVISASTSGGMAKRLVEVAGFEADRVTTLVDLLRTNRSGLTLFALEDINSPVLDQFPTGTETQIELVGEHFSLRSKPPRPVTLTKAHGPASLGALLKKVSRDAELSLNSPAGGRSRIVAFKGVDVISSAAFSEWLKEEISWSMPASIDHIIAVDENGSFELASRCASIIQEVKGLTVSPVVLKASELSKDALKDARGVAVVQAVAGDGGALREVSRDLREYLKTETPRHFLLALGVPQSADTWDRLRQFLVRNPSERLYGFSAWLNLSLGFDSVKSSWDVYAEVASKMQTVSVEPGLAYSEVVAQSIAKAEEVIGESYNGFLPSTLGGRLRLTDGFVFFPSSVKIEHIPDSTVYLTMTAVLQNARDAKGATAGLKATSYESVVLSPENFLRFNDNILQACLLRAALPAELDFSSSRELSGLMCEFLIKIFARHNQAYGAAALEFAMALLSRRMRLTDSDFNRVCEYAFNLLRKENSVSPLFGLIYLLGRV